MVWTEPRRSDALDLRRTAASVPAPSADAPHQPVCTLTSGDFSISEALSIVDGHASLVVDEEIRALIRAGRLVVEQALDRGDVVYGLNTHLGFRRNEVVAADELWLYQDFVVSTHAAAVGERLTDRETRAVLLARICGMAGGGSGVSPAVFQLLVDMLNAGVLPVIPATGSVGASDLTQMAAVAEVVAGRGRAVVNGTEHCGLDALALTGLKPATLGPKDALALISSNAVSIGLAALATQELHSALRWANAAAALTIEGVSGNLDPFGAAVVEKKRLSGQQAVAGELRRLLKGSRLEHSVARRNVQDAISLRTIPQVHGCLLEYVDRATDAVLTELNAAADNPVVVFENDALVSNGNFAPMELAVSFEAVRIALVHVAQLSERRLHKLLLVRHGHQTGTSGVPGRVPNLIVNAAASLFAEIKHLAQPVTLGSVSLNSDVEDHASLAPLAVAHTRRATALLEQLLAVELLLASDTVSLLGPDVVLGQGTRSLKKTVDKVANRHVPGSTSGAITDLVAVLRGEQPS